MMNPTSLCREDLLLDPAYRQNQARQRDLTGHGEVRVHSPPVSVEIRAIADSDTG